MCEALSITICTVSPISSISTDKKLTLIALLLQQSPSRRTGNCPESDIHLALPAPQRHGFNGIIAYFGGNCKGIVKNNRRHVLQEAKRLFQKRRTTRRSNEREYRSAAFKDHISFEVYVCSCIYLAPDFLHCFLVKLRPVIDLTGFIRY